MNHFQLLCSELVFFFFIVGREKTAINSERLENNKTTHQVTREWWLAEKGATQLVKGNLVVEHGTSRETDCQRRDKGAF